MIKERFRFKASLGMVQILFVDQMENFIFVKITWDILEVLESLQKEIIRKKREPTKKESKLTKENTKREQICYFLF